MNRKILMILMIFSVFITIGAVSANNMTDDSTTEILSEYDEDMSFTALNATINSGMGVIEITKDYKFNDESDEDFSNGINITQDNLVINGNNQ